MSKAGAGLIAPMGFAFDPQRSMIDNARVAWETELATRRAQSEHNAKVLSRRVFRTDEIAFAYHGFAPLVPTLEVDGEVIGFQDGAFQLIEFCGECGEDWLLRSFGSIAGFGRALAERDEAEAFVCRRCEWLEYLNRKRGRRDR